MKPQPNIEITQLLLDWSGGNPAALTELFPLVYDELRAMAQGHLRRERGVHTLQRTALVHEAFLRLVDQRNVDWQSRAHFFGLASQMMRRILVDYARKLESAKRGGKKSVRLNVDDLLRNAEAEVAADEYPGAFQAPDVADFSLIDEVLTRLERMDPRQGKLVELRFFGGLSLEEAADTIGVSLATVKRDWFSARAWLQRELTDAS